MVAWVTVPGHGSKRSIKEPFSPVRITRALVHVTSCGPGKLTRTVEGQCHHVRGNAR